MVNNQVGDSDLNTLLHLNLMADVLYKNALTDILKDLGIFSKYVSEEEACHDST